MGKTLIFIEHSHGKLQKSSQVAVSAGLKAGNAAGDTIALVLGKGIDAIADGAAKLGVGKVVVMEPADFSAWLSGGPGEDSPAAAGRRLFETIGCAPCHSAESGARGPALDHLFGGTVKLADGRSVAADETYLRESILDPRAKLVAGYEPIMPANYRDLLSEEGILQVVAYIKSLRKGEAKDGSRP